MLEKATRLRRQQGLTFRWEETGRVEIETVSGWTWFGPRALSILETFGTGERFEMAVARLAARATGPLDLVELAAEIMRLRRYGVLVDERESGSGALDSEWFFSAPRTHLSMLEDRHRTDCLLRAVRQECRSGDRVVDIGSGTGVLAVAAAQSGAGHVHAIEGGAMADFAAALIDASGVSERVTLLREWSRSVELATPADLIVTETISDDPLAEGILETIWDASRRLLAPGGRVIPRALRLFVQPMTAPRDYVQKERFTPEVLLRWESWYGVPFGRVPLEQGQLAGLSRPSKPSFARVAEVAGWPLLGDPVLVMDASFPIRGGLPSFVEAIVEVATSGTLSAFVMWFEADLAEGIILGTDPRDPVVRGTHWHSAVWVVEPAVVVSPGARFALTMGRVAGRTTLQARRLP